MKKYSAFCALFALLLLGTLSFSPNQILKTSLRLTILDDLGNPVEGAKVSLYGSQEDYREETNRIGETETSDKKGRVKFTQLEPTVYYIHAEKDGMSNAGAGAQTDTLQNGRINKITIIIE